MPKLSVLEQAKLNRILSTNSDRIRRLESILRGQQFGTVRFADASILEAKISSLIADKIDSGQIAVGEEIRINDGSNDIIVITSDYIKIAKVGFNADIAGTKNLILDSGISCLKIVELGIREFTINNTVTTVYEQNITTPFPIYPKVFLYNPTLGMYKEAGPLQHPNYFDDYLHVEYEFTSSKLYTTVSNNTGSNVTTHYYWYIMYA